MELITSIAVCEYTMRQVVPASAERVKETYVLGGVKIRVISIRSSRSALRLRRAAAATASRDEVGADLIWARSWAGMRLSAFGFGTGGLEAFLVDQRRMRMRIPLLIMFGVFVVGATLSVLVSGVEERGKERKWK